MKLTDIINLKYFLFSFFIGVMVVYFWGCDTNIIKVYPNPLNFNEIQYKDKSNSCFDFKMHEMTCPTDETLIEHVPIQ